MRRRARSRRHSRPSQIGHNGLHRILSLNRTVFADKQLIMVNTRKDAQGNGISLRKVKSLLPRPYYQSRARKLSTITKIRFYSARLDRLSVFAAILPFLPKLEFHRRWWLRSSTTLCQFPRLDPRAWIFLLPIRWQASVERSERLSRNVAETRVAGGACRGGIATVPRRQRRRNFSFSPVVNKKGRPRHVHSYQSANFSLLRGGKLRLHARVGKRGIVIYGTARER